MTLFAKPTLAVMAGAALLTAVVFAPAAWLAGTISRVTKERVQLLSPSGTVWSGSAALQLGSDAGEATTALPTRVHWKLSLAGLSLKSACCTPKGVVALRFYPRAFLGLGDKPMLELISPSLQVSASLLSGLGAPWNSLKPQGEMSLSSLGLQIHLDPKRPDAWRLTGQAQLQVRGFSTALSTVSPLGDYQLAFSDGTLQLTSSPGAALTLQGAGALVGANLRLSGEALAAKQQEAGLTNLLHIIGQRQDTADGRARATWEIKV